MTTPNPTERRPRETAVAYEAFRTYLMMGPARSTAKVARACGKHKSLMDRWSARWEWVERVRSFEAQAAAAADRETLDVIADRAKRQAEIAQLHGEVTSLIPREVFRRIQVAADAGTNWLEEVEVGDLLRIEAMLARAHRAAVVTERLALGISTDNPSAPNTSRTAAEEAAARLSPDELTARLAGFDELGAKRRQKRKRTA